MIKNNLLKFFAFVFCLFIFSGFSNVKQTDEYSCAPVCATNYAVDKKLCHNTVEAAAEFSKIFKTDSNGTTSQNFAEGLYDYLTGKGFITEIKYWGIRPVDESYKALSEPDICKELGKGNAVILNTGVYKNENGVYKRQYGHFLNANACSFKGIDISDPYSKKAVSSTMKLTKMRKGIFLHNENDNEAVINNPKFHYYKLTPSPEYLKSDEVMLLNGVFVIKAK